MEGSEIVLRDLVDYYCSIFLFDNARFYAERLFYTNPNSDNLFLLARCYRGLGKIKQVYHLLRDDTYPPNRYHFAQVCIELGKYQEVHHTLLPSSVTHPNNLTDADVARIPGGGAGLYLLGITCRKENRKDFAVAYFKKALQV
jgi:tetratricopeptide (TPR) repeat protein